MGPRAASAFLVVSAILFAALLSALAWRGGATAWLAAAVIVGLFMLALGVLFARGVGEGRL